MTLKNVLAANLVIALGVILIIHFTLFWMHGGVFIYENNKIILSIETVMSLAILAFGVERLVNTARERYKQGTSTSSSSRVKRRTSIDQVISPSFLRNSEKADVPTSTVTTVMPRISALLTESGSDYTEYSSFRIATCTQDAGAVSIYTLDDEREPTIQTEGV